MSLEELILRHATGTPIPTMDRQPDAVGVMMIPIPKAGILRSIEGIEEAKLVGGIVDIEFTAPLGHPIYPLPEGSSYLGFIFARAASPERVEQAIREAHELLRIDIRPMMSLRVEGL